MAGRMTADQTAKELREALNRWEWLRGESLTSTATLHYLAEHQPHLAVRIMAAAQRELARLEGKALVIEIDEDGEWPHWALLAMSYVEEMAIGAGRECASFVEFLDVLRDAMAVRNVLRDAMPLRKATRLSGERHTQPQQPSGDVRDAMPDEEATSPVCELCGGPMPEGEEMFKYHGYSGPCPRDAMPEAQS